jgi:hypothetical protein
VLDAVMEGLNDVFLASLRSWTFKGALARSRSACSSFAIVCTISIVNG